MGGRANTPPSPEADSLAYAAPPKPSGGFGGKSAAAKVADAKQGKAAGGAPDSPPPKHRAAPPMLPSQKDIAAAGGPPPPAGYPQTPPRVSPVGGARVVDKCGDSRPSSRPGSAVQQRLQAHSQVGPNQSPVSSRPTSAQPERTASPVKAAMKSAKSAPALPVAGKRAPSPKKGAKKPTPFENPLNKPAAAAASSTSALQQRATSHPKVAASPMKAARSALVEVTRACSLSDTTFGSTVSSEGGVLATKPDGTNTLPVGAPTQPVGDALLTHGLAGFIVAVAGEYSLTAQSTAPQAVHLFCSALVFLLFGVCISLMLDDDTQFTTPWSNMGLPADGLLTAATAGGIAAAFTLAIILVQRGVFAYARGMWAATKAGSVLRKRPVLRLALGWLLNFGLYGAAVAGAVCIAHYRLDNVQLTVGFSTRATMALLWNLCATEPLGALFFAAVIRYRNDRRRRKQVEFEIRRN